MHIAHCSNAHIHGSIDDVPMAFCWTQSRWISNRMKKREWKSGKVINEMQKLQFCAAVEMKNTLGVKQQHILQREFAPVFLCVLWLCSCAESFEFHFSSAFRLVSNVQKHELHISVSFFSSWNPLTKLASRLFMSGNFDRILKTDLQCFVYDKESYKKCKA